SVEVGEESSYFLAAATFLAHGWNLAGINENRGVFRGAHNSIAMSLRRNVEEAADMYEGKGFRIVRRFREDRFSFMSAWQESGILGIAFAGHGFRDEGKWGGVFFGGDRIPFSGSGDSFVEPRNVNPPYRLALI